MPIENGRRVVSEHLRAVFIVRRKMRRFAEESEKSRQAPAMTMLFPLATVSHDELLTFDVW